ncbi:MAG: aryl-sulfate sulfotransferase [Saprospiraceae bacterium]|nr:aryl-sulfate sulfotransferase [Saprospiraceae bacterium]
MVINVLKSSFIIFLLFLSSGNVFCQVQTMGVTTYDKSATYNGYIFYSPFYYSDAYLIDNCGFLVNSWDRNNRPGLSGYLTKSGLMLRTNKVIGAQYSQLSTGGNIELVDWNNNTIWSSDFNEFEFIQHHDAVLMPNGNIIFIGWERISQSEQIAYGRVPNNASSPYLWGEFIQEIKPIGSSDYEIVWEWHLQDHFVQDYNPSLSNFGVVRDEIGKVDINYLGPGAWDDDDWWHCNALDYNPALDQILVNSRNNNELWIIDHSTTTQQAQGSSGGNSGKGGELLFRWGNPAAYKRGTSANLKMYGSHGHYWIPSGLPNAGKIMYFNNGDDRPQGYYSTVELIEPIFENGEYKKMNNQHYYPIQPEIVYEAPNPFDFVSTYLSNAQQLPNGNVFINEGGTGRLFEIDSNNNIVWEYITPVNYNGPNNQGAIITSNSNFRAYKYAAEHPALINKDLSPGELIEGDSEFNKCKDTSTEDQFVPDGFSINYVLGSNLLTIQNDAFLQLDLTIFSSSGKQIISTTIGELRNDIDLSSLNQGIYVIRITSNENKNILTKRIVKF